MYALQHAPQGCKTEPLRLTEPIAARPKFQQPLRAELSGSNTATITASPATDITSDITVQHYTPVLILCRELLAQGVDPDRALELYRGSTLAIRVLSVGEAAGLEIAGDGIGFRPARRPDAALPMRKNDRRGSMVISATAAVVEVASS